MNDQKTVLKDLVFDMGNVLIEFKPEELVRRCGLSEEDEQLILDKVFHSPDWKLHDLGVLDEDTMFENACRILPDRLHDAAAQMIYRWHEPLIPVQGMAELLKEMKDRGLRIYLLSNAGKDQPSYWNRTPGAECFSGTVISAFEGCIKPDPKIYGILLERYGLDPKECLFIDDVEENIAGAKRAGMDAYLFRNDTDRLKEYIEERLR